MCFNSKEREIKMKIAAVKQQTNEIDCDLYAKASIKYIYGYYESLKKFSKS